MATTPRRRPPRSPQIGDELLLYGGVWHVVEAAAGGKWLRLQWSADVPQAESDSAWLDLGVWRDLHDAMKSDGDEDTSSE